MNHGTDPKMLGLKLIDTSSKILSSLQKKR